MKPKSAHIPRLEVVASSRIPRLAPAPTTAFVCLPKCFIDALFSANTFFVGCYTSSPSQSPYTHRYNYLTRRHNNKNIDPIMKRVCSYALSQLAFLTYTVSSLTYKYIIIRPTHGRNASNQFKANGLSQTERSLHIYTNSLLN